MKVSQKNVLGALAAAFVAGGLLSACSTSKNTDGGGSSSGGTSSGSAACNAAGAACTVASECCTGLTCTGNVCTTPCGAAGDNCSAAAACCTPLVCDATSNTCLTGTGDGGGSSSGGCPSSPAFGPCLTAANCAPPNVCQPASDGGGYCGPVTVQPSATCTANGQTCTATTVCCGGNCVGGTCTARAACGVSGQGCNVAGDCCNNFKCVQGAGADNGDGGADDAGVDAGATDGGSANSSSGSTGSNSGSSSSSSSGSTGSSSGSSSGSSGSSSGGTTFTGVCQPSCAPILGACSTTNGSADCCTTQGLTCLPFAANGVPGVCYPAQYTDQTTGDPIYCGGPCSDFPCQLGLSCQVPTTGASAGSDPCASSGLVCDPNYGVCRNPAEGDPCIPGSVPCQPYANSTVTDLQCLPLPANFGGAYACLQPCALTDPGKGTSDCVDPLMVCTSLGAGHGAACVFNEGCTNYYGACNSAGVGDGYCEPYNFSNGFGGLCFQATLDGGTPGSACDGTTRQNGAFCDPTSYCLAGICEAVCNSGTKGGPTCAQADAGPTVGCADLTGQGSSSKSPAAQAFGVCSADCDFTSATGGGCPTVDGVPEKCFPPAEFALPDAPTGLCIEAVPASDAVAVGQPCDSFSIFADECVDGAVCVFNESNAGSTCLQLCTQVATAGQAPCNSDQVCNALFGTETHQGYCGLADGGIGG